jgi:hypothetical protein
MRLSLFVVVSAPLLLLLILPCAATLATCVIC